MKKSIIFAISVLCSITFAFAQEYKVKLANSKDRKVTIEMTGGDFKIEGYNGDEVIVSTSSRIESPPEQAKGLKPLYYTAVDNSGIGLAVTTDESGVKIEKATRKSMKYVLKLPKQVAVLYRETNWQHGGAVTISNVDGDIEIRTNNSPINLTNVTGPIVANSTSGEIKVVYSSLSQTKPTAISSVAGAIDISLPASTKSTMKLHSVTGEMYTDFDLGLKTTKDRLTRIGTSRNIEGNTNGGGVEVQIHSVSSDIFIRKQK